MAFNELSRLDLEETQDRESLDVANALSQIEGSDLTPQGKEAALARVAMNLEMRRMQQKEELTGKIEKVREKYEKKQGTADMLKYQRSKDKIESMTDEELVNYEHKLHESDGFWDGDEIRAMMARFKKTEPVRHDQLKEAAVQRRAFEPWTHDGPGKELKDEYEDIARRPPGKVIVHNQGIEQLVEMPDLLDVDGQLN